jgi:hypothetical protein
MSKDPEWVTNQYGVKYIMSNGVDLFAGWEWGHDVDGKLGDALDALSANAANLVLGEILNDADLDIRVSDGKTVANLYLLDCDVHLRVDFLELVREFISTHTLADGTFPPEDEDDADERADARVMLAALREAIDMLESAMGEKVSTE